MRGAVKPDKDNSIDLIFVFKKKVEGWILEGIAEEIGKYYSGKWICHYLDDSLILPKAKNYYFMHYSLLGRSFKLNPILWDRGTLVHYTHPRLDAPKDRKRELVFLFNRCTRVICQNTDAYQQLQEDGVRKERLACVVGGADEIIFKGHERNDGAVGFSTAYYERKRPDVIHAIIKSMPHRKFYLLGPGSKEKAARHRHWEQYEKFNEMKALPNLTYIEAPYSDYPKYYDKIDVMVSVSNNEAGPIPLIEAIMCNMTIVASKTGFAPDVIEHGKTGYLCEVDDDPEVICQYIDQAFSLKTNVRERGSEWTWKQYSQKVQEYFKS